MTNPFQSLILCALLCITLATPVTLHVSQYNVPDVSPQEQQKIMQEYTCLKTALYHEARGEPIEGIKAVLSIIQNRKNHKDYPSTYCGVIKQPYQFSYYNTIKHDRILYKVAEAKVSVNIALLAFEAAQGRFKTNLDSEYVFFHATKLKKNFKWNDNSKTKITIGNHVFIKQ